MRPLDPKPALYVHNGDELSLSGPQMIELIKSVLSKGASFRFRASGQSMSPFIRDGDVLTLAPVKTTSFGDVIAFISPVNGHLVVHRLLRKSKGNFDLKGDNLGNYDSQVPPDNILGKVTRVERAKKTVRLGIGADKFMIALLSRLNILILINRIIYAAYSLTRKVIP